ncbi:MAG: carboxylate--amine ligase, partial [Aliifodinibius sp.]|nr:carboxylate--amine ligase [Phycisphaerae bacterium]NIT61755.1 carboxylate--amine ligase [Fodinibius sp.]NIV10429.1 carboxylate--amine ligase [Fodinibius sp.]NIY30335.1 carboxylate--amine ligase [Fodinibius sp.]
FALENGIPTPKAVGFSHRQDAVAGVGHLAYPLIIKPVDLTGGKGIAVVDNEKGLRE